ncbi:pollen-specific leucine-rich repeat extensin-like protein 4 [Iris pallida]|uniref:Pollen-specific leucine-rich repeat extensin-like protein 4 n=1 Tax=Iris pallida TaxID=29817 RepID=A0AAX6DXW1_IRIPA|nr:pollen-specific leucine-rich repeat extensin-like protein 4 [Iris pallida]KAJ6833248.1 pollen-specific leucine-rich repeat extensin-like protein 4 [Iris pallida]
MKAPSHSPLLRVRCNRVSTAPPVSRRGKHPGERLRRPDRLVLDRSVRASSMAPSSPPASSVQSPEPWPLPRPPDQCRSPRLEPPFRRTRDVSTERRPRLRRDVAALQIGPSLGVPNRAAFVACLRRTPRRSPNPRSRHLPLSVSKFLSAAG